MALGLWGKCCAFLRHATKGPTSVKSDVTGESFPLSQQQHLITNSVLETERTDVAPVTKLSSQRGQLV